MRCCAARCARWRRLGIDLPDRPVKTRLERTGFFKEVNVETPQVHGTDDQIDVNYSVEEQPSGSIMASIGFAQNAGLILAVPSVRTTSLVPVTESRWA